MLKWLSIEDCIKNNTCWSPGAILEYAKKHGDGNRVKVLPLLNNPDIYKVDKMWVVDAVGLLKESDYHWLAIEYAAHVLEDANKAGMKALTTKAMWIKGRVTDEELENAEKDAWNEAKYYPKSKAAAFAAKKDPKLALKLSSALAAGWYGEVVDPEEINWQWSLMVDRLEGIDG